MQVRNSQTRAVDGPFSESKEMIGGFFLLNLSTRDDALAWAARCPAAAWTACLPNGFTKPGTFASTMATSSFSGR